VYLSIFNFVPTPDNNLSYLWSRGYWIPAFGWIFYFVLGYYSGIYYEKLLIKLHEYKLLVFLAPILTFVFVIMMRYYELPAASSSKRIDVLFYTISIIYLIIYLTSKIENTPIIVIFISNYSFSIYLLHKILIDSVDKITTNIYMHIMLTFILGI